MGIGGLYFKPYNPKKPLSVEQCALNVTSHNQSYFDDLNAKAAAGNSDIFVLYRLSYLYYGLVGAGVTIIAGLIISRLTGPGNDMTADAALFVPFVNKRVVKRQATEVIGQIADISYHPRSSDAANNNINAVNNRHNQIHTIQLALKSGNSKKDAIKFEGIINIAFEADVVRNMMIQNANNPNRVDMNRLNSDNDMKVTPL